MSMLLGEKKDDRKPSFYTKFVSLFCDVYFLAF